MKRLLSLILAFGGLLLVTAAVLFFIPKDERVTFLYATDGDKYDRGVFSHFDQSLAANVKLERRAVNGLHSDKLAKYDGIYLDPGLDGTPALEEEREALEHYVQNGGHLLLDNAFADQFPPEFLGAAQLVDVKPPQTDKPAFAYPETDANLRGIQDVFRLFADNFNRHIGMSHMPGFVWGKGLVPSTAETLVSLDGVSLLTVNRAGKGTVMLNSAFLPNRYFITGFDLQSGMDPDAGYQTLQEQRKPTTTPRDGIKYFDFKQGLPPEPYFQFAFASANAQMRTAYLGYVGKETAGYSITKVLGTHGRPAMAFENHFEALPAFQEKSGIQWAELLKQHDMIPSYSLVRGSYAWGEWHEDVTVHLNEGTSAKPAFTGQYANSFYGSGARLAGTDGKPLTLALYPEYKELANEIPLPYRAYPAIADWTGDGKPDLLAGSADGTVTLFPGQGAQPAAYVNQPLPDGVAAPDAFGAGQPVRLAGGEPLRLAAGYAAIAAAPPGGNGVPDLIIGDAGGKLLRSRNLGNGTFAPPEPLAAGGGAAAVPAYAAPAWGDLDGDGIPDLVVGDGDGAVHWFRGVAAAGGGAPRFEEGRVLFRAAGRFAAPSVRDMNGDGKADLVVGTNEGDVRVYEQGASMSEWTDKGPLTGSTLNQMGNHALVGGHNAVPLWYDINHDGKDDLLVGQLEFGLPVTVDDPAFPHTQELQEFLQYAKDNYLELYPHVFVHGYQSDEQEKQELALQRESFRKLGLPWVNPGTNQHTWRINNDQRLQTLRNESEQDIWFNFGFRPSYNPNDPRAYTDYMWGTPFLLQDDQLKQPMLLYTPLVGYTADGPYATTDIYEAQAKLDMPLDYMEHIDQIPYESKKAAFEPFVKYFDAFRTQHDYNFMTEQQMARSFLAALTSDVRVQQSWGGYLVGRLKDKLGSGLHLDVKLTADTSAVPAQAGAYTSAVGVRIEPGARYAAHPLGVDADIYKKTDTALYASLRKPARLFVNWQDEGAHLIRANGPVELDKKNGVWTLRLTEPGLQQVKLYSPAPVRIEGEDLKIERSEAERTYTITHYGQQAAITIHF
ncbi:hypothetical protein J31TS4_43040 [Paenibacillus sp. J31TS4]|uniref:FG-GAP repeat domain-containing protein n=1 Tax=Paenibacillus sp. J31TS4 TaxID=2807195 RepID=UPI001AFFD9FD|nr:VCBS repeat-containing protein [Paenibacillus sp. J31TS4]GIP41024.1 hypothetical protein J31TS4_43040 [Paenibacillus sp. J31TS4]